MFNEFVFCFRPLDFCSPGAALLHVDRVRLHLSQFYRIWANMWCDPAVLSAAAPSWRRWTPLRRCGCRSGNTKTTERVPSTGRPSSRGQNSPRTVLKPPPPMLLSETPAPVLSGYLCVINLLPAFCFFLSRFRESHLGVRQFPWQPPIP